MNYRMGKGVSEQKIEQLPDGTLQIQSTWPQLGRVFYRLEHDAIDANASLSEKQKKELRDKVKEIIIDQCSTYERQYEAFEYVIRGRAVEIVGNPHYIGKDGKTHELPYTGLEGCYAGSEKKLNRPGLTQEQIIEEEATIGLELLKRLKKDSIEHYAWSSFARIHDPENGALDREDLKRINLLWTSVVRRLNQRIYENQEYKKTPLEQVEAILKGDSRLASDRHIQEEYSKLLKEEEAHLKNETPEERARRYEKERILHDRLEEHERFRNETYAHLKDAIGREYHIEYRIDDRSFPSANIIETLRLPKPPDRNTAPPYIVKLTPAQLEGYLFLAHLGEKGGNPVTRSVLTTEEE